MTVPLPESKGTLFLSEAEIVLGGQNRRHCQRRGLHCCFLLETQDAYCTGGFLWYNSSPEASEAGVENKDEEASRQAVPLFFLEGEGWEEGNAPCAEM